MLNKEDITLIDKYLDDELSADEIKLFKKHFETSSEFAKEVKQQTDLRVALKSLVKQRTQLKEKPKSKKIPFGYYIMAVAASVALLITFSIYRETIFGNSGPYQNLYADFYQNPLEGNADFVMRSAESEADKQAIKKFKEAINLMENKKFEDATILLQELYQQNNDLLFDEASWYLALAYLQTEQVEKATGIFIDLYNSDSKFSEESFEIYNEINSIKNQQKN